jgi:hypothetical protein
MSNKKQKQRTSEKKITVEGKSISVSDRQIRVGMRLSPLSEVELAKIARLTKRTAVKKGKK